MKTYLEYYEDLRLAFAGIRDAGITCRRQLNRSRNNALRGHLWVAAENLIRHCALPARYGTAAFLKSARLEETDGLVHEILIKVFDKLDLVLAQPLKVQVPYILCMVYRHLSDEKKKTKRAAEANAVSLSTPFGEEQSELGELIPDEKNCGVAEDYAMRCWLLEVFSLLSDRPAELFVLLAGLLDWKPRELRVRLQQEGSGLFMSILKEFALKYHLSERDVLRACLPESIPDSSLEDLTSARISRLNYRAVHRLAKVLKPGE